jgi:hypothetical protein
MWTCTQHYCGLNGPHTSLPCILSEVLQIFESFFFQIEFFFIYFCGYYIRQSRGWFQQAWKTKFIMRYIASRLSHHKEE